MPILAVTGFLLGNGSVNAHTEGYVMRSTVVESQPSAPSSASVSHRGSNDVGWSLTKSRPQFSAGPTPEDPASQAATQPAKPTEGWFVLVLLVIAVSTVVFSLLSAHWVSHTTLLFLSTMVGLLLGIGVAKIQRMPQAILHLAACLAGHWLSVWLTSAAFHVSWMFLLGNLRTAITGGLATTAAPGTELIFFFYLSFLCFYLGYFGTWLIYRARLPWLVALVYCSIFLINLHYVRQDLSLLLIILLTALTLLIVRIQLVTQLAQWTSAGLHTDHSWLRSITKHCMQLGSIFALLVLLISWLLPTVSQPAEGVVVWTHLNNAWTNITHGNLSTQNPGAIIQPYESATTFFSNQLTITGNISLPSGEVLHYTSTAAPQYLEGFTFDHFDGHTWISSLPGRQQNFNADSLLPTDTAAITYKRATTDVTIVQPPSGSKNYIFAPAQPVAFDVATTVYINGSTSTWTQQSPLALGEHYRATSNITRATAQDLSAVPLPQQGPTLRARGDRNYTTLINTYLQLPNGLSPKIRTTAQKWTRGATNTYDAAKLLEANLSDSTQFTYSLSNPPIPANVDVVSWLLQTQQGYCTYYASAMTIMARQMGIPARMVNGFSQGHFDAQRKVWVINGDDAHSWVQLYFPGYGWINFDPTPGYSLHNAAHPQPTPSPLSTKHPIKAIPTSPVPDTQPAQHTGSNPQTGTTPATMARQSLLLGLSILTLLCFLGFLLIALCSYWWRNLYASANFVSRTFWRVCYLAGWGGIPPQRWQTPYEYSNMLSQQFPQATASLQHLTELFVHDRWAAPHETLYAEDNIEHLWPHLRSLLLLRLVLLRFRMPKRTRMPK